MKQNIPSPQADEKEADRVIANYGRKPAPEKKQDLMTMLRKEKAKFKEQERGSHNRTTQDRTR